MATWTVTPKFNGLINNNDGVIVFPPNIDDYSDITYNITYIDDYGCSDQTTYTAFAKNMVLTVDNIYGVKVGDTIKDLCNMTYDKSLNTRIMIYFHTINGIAFSIILVFDDSRLVNIKGTGMKYQVNDVDTLYTTITEESYSGNITFPCNISSTFSIKKEERKIDVFVSFSK